MREDQEPHTVAHAHPRKCVHRAPEPALHRETCTHFQQLGTIRANFPHSRLALSLSSKPKLHFTPPVATQFASLPTPHPPYLISSISHAQPLSAQSTHPFVPPFRPQLPPLLRLPLEPRWIHCGQAGTCT
eukprot:894492-Pleurochrysis_carterae.AAC.2